MAEKDESSLIGYDPLAWMHQQAGEAEMPAAEPPASPDDKAEAWGITDEVEISTEEAEVSGWQDIELDGAEDSLPENAAIVLESVLSIQNVAQLHQRFLDALNSFDKIEIDASAVTMVDTATLQLLLILKRTAINLQKEVVIDFPSDRFIEAAELLGISEMLEVDQAAAGFF